MNKKLKKLNATSDDYDNNDVDDVSDDDGSKDFDDSNDVDACDDVNYVENDRNDDGSEQPSNSQMSEEDENEDDSGRGPYGPNSKPSNTFEVLIRGWNIHLSTPDGTEKTPVRIRQMCGQVAAIAKAVDPKPKDLSVFLNKDLVYRKFFKTNMKERESGKGKGFKAKSLSGFSISLERFLTYVLPSMKRSLSTENRKKLENLRDVQRSWRESWCKKIAIERAELEWEAEKNLPTLEELKSLEKSNHAKHVCTMLLNPHKYTIGPDEVQDARNYLIFLINYENVNRAGPVSEIKLSKLREGIKDGDKWTIQIARQKTTKTHGGVILNFSEKLYTMITKYIKYFRPIFAVKAKEDEEALFLNSTGTPYTNSHVHHALKQFATNAGSLRPESLTGFCSSMIRHVVVTNTRHLTSPEKNNLASKMGHTRQTADRSYNLINKRRAAASAHTAVSNLLSTSAAIEPEVKSRDEKPEVESGGEKPEFESGGEKPEMESDPESEVNTIPPTEVDPETKPIISMVRKFRRVFFSRQDTETLTLVCDKEITGLTVPTRKEIVHRMNSNPETKLIVQKEGEERCYQKVKHLRRDHMKK